jgi:hypothetical protein
MKAAEDMTVNELLTRVKELETLLSDAPMQYIGIYGADTHYWMRLGEWQYRVCQALGIERK